MISFKKHLVFILAVTFSVSACSNENTVAEAELLCEQYNPENWGDDKKIAFQESFQIIQKNIQEKIQSNKLKELLGNIDEADFPSYHKTYHQKVEEFLSEKWECEFFDEYFFPKSAIVNIPIGTQRNEYIDLSNGKNTIVSINDNGDLFINGNPLINSKKETLIKAINMTKKGSDQNYYVSAEKNVSYQKLTTLLDALKSLEISNVGLIKN